MRPFDDLVLKTERLLLRPLRPPDAEPLFSIFSDPRVMRYWSGPPWAGVNRAHEFIARDMAAHRAGEYLRLGIATHDSPAPIGMCTLFSFMPQCRRAEIGYALSSAAWGRGYMQEALAALLDFGFGELALHRIEADVDPRNIPSTRCLERLGFRKEGHLRERWIVGEEISDTIYYGLLNREWQARASG